MPCVLAVLHTDTRALLNSLTLDWASTSPPGLTSSDYWAARFSFVLLAPVTGNYTIAATVDDFVSMAIDGEEQLPSGGSRRTAVWLDCGYHDVVLHFLEVTGAANLRMTWDAGVLNAVSDTVFQHASYVLQSAAGLKSDCYHCCTPGQGPCMLLMQIVGAGCLVKAGIKGCASMSHFFFAGACAHPGKQHPVSAPRAACACPSSRQRSSGTANLQQHHNPGAADPAACVTS
jgi:hypothetical protein